MQHLIDHNDIFFLREHGHNPIGWQPCPISEDGHINPQVTKTLLDNGQCATVFHVKPVYYETIYETWRPLSEVTSYHGNKKIIIPYEKLELIHPRFLNWLSKRQRLLGSELLITSPYTNKLIGLTETAISLTTSTFYPDPDPETTTMDAYLFGPNNVSWDTCHDSATASSVNDTNTVLRGGSSATFSAYGFIYRSLSLYDTSSIGSDTVDSAYFSGKTATKQLTNNDAYAYLSIVQSSPASNTAIAIGDYDAIGDAINNPTEGVDSGDRVSVSSISVDSYSDFTFNSTGLDWIATSGVTKLGSRSGHDIEDVQPAGQGYTGWNYYGAEESGTTSDSKLVVEHSAGGGGGQNSNFLMFM